MDVAVSDTESEVVLAFEKATRTSTRETSAVVSSRNGSERGSNFGSPIGIRQASDLEREDF